MTRRLKALLFLLAVIPLGGAGLAALIAGWVLVATLAITPLVVPALVAFRVAVGGVTRLDGVLANSLLGTDVDPQLTSPGPGGFWNSGLNVVRDPRSGGSRPTSCCGCRSASRWRWGSGR